MPEHLQRRVHEECQQRNAELGLQPFGTVSADGYRPSAELAPRGEVGPYGMEHNIDVLFRMGLANRRRAQHTLEAMGNNLQQAVDLLLALQVQGIGVPDRVLGLGRVE